MKKGEVSSICPSLESGTSIFLPYLPHSPIAIANATIGADHLVAMGLKLPCPFSNWVAPSMQVGSTMSSLRCDPTGTLNPDLHNKKQAFNHWPKDAIQFRKFDQNSGYLCNWASLIISRGFTHLDLFSINLTSLLYEDATIYWQIGGLIDELIIWLIDGLIDGLSNRLID